MNSNDYDPAFDSIIELKETFNRLFGNDKPSLSERTIYFFNLWCDWEDNSVSLGCDHSKVNSIMRDLGFKVYEDFMVRNGEIRCKNKEDLAFAMMSGLKDLEADHV